MVICARKMVTCLGKMIFLYKFPTKVEMNLETEFMTTGFVTLKVVTKMKNK